MRTNTLNDLGKPVRTPENSTNITKENAHTPEISPKEKENTTKKTQQSRKMTTTKYKKTKEIRK